MSEPSTVDVLIVYHHLPHYRYDVFRCLEDDATLNVEFAAAAASRDGSIATIPGSALRSVHTLSNLWLGPFLWQRGLGRLVRGRRFHAVIFLGDAKHLSSWAAALWCRLVSGSAVLFWTIGWFRPEKGAHRLYKMTFYRLAHSLLIYGNFGRRLGIRLGYPGERMTVVYNSSSGPTEARSVDPARLARFAAALPPAGEQVIGAVLRLNPVKKLPMLLEAAAALRAGGRPVSVLLVGEGPEQAGLERRAAELGVPLWLPGPAYAEAELALVYERITVTVIPSSAGLSVLQSFRFGRPVITHDNMYEQVPECEAIVPGVTGDLYPFEDLDALVRLVAGWLDVQSDRSAQTAVDCRAALESTWNAHVQTSIISDEVRRRVAERRHGSRVRL